MTDNNADETDGQNSKLSRRTAVALMGTSAVGGAAATSAFSQLTADRSVNVDVVSSGADSETGDTSNSELQVGNNSGQTLDAEISTSDSNVSLVGLTGNSTASISGTNPWTLSGLGNSETATIEFERTSAEQVSFDVTAFSATSGFSIDSTQVLNVLDQVPDAANLHAHYDMYQQPESDGQTIDPLVDQSGNGYDVPAFESPTMDVDGFNGNPAAQLDGSGDHWLLDGSNFDNLTQPFTVYAVVVLDDPGKSRRVFEYINSSNRVFLQEYKGNWRIYAGGSTIEGSTDLSINVLTVVYNGSTSLIEEAGSQTGSGNAGGNALAGMPVGARREEDGSKADFFSGSIMQLLFYNGAHDGTTRDNVVSYLNSRWDV